MTFGKVLHLSELGILVYELGDRNPALLVSLDWEAGIKSHA